MATEPAMTDPGLPTFVVIGAAKSGTTSLYHYLSAHPGVYMSPVKEPRFFAFEGHDPALVAALRHPVVTSLDGYRRLFAGARPDQARGEASVAYLHTEGVIGRMRRLIPDASLVVLLRHPAEAVWSGYLMARRNFGLEAPLDELIDNEPLDPVTDLQLEHGPGHLIRGRMYHRHLTRWLSAWPEGRLLVCLHDDLRDHPTELLKSVCRHIGVDPDISLAGETRHNVSFLPRSPRLFQWLNRPGPALLAFKRVARRLPGVRSLRARADAWNRLRPPTLPEATRSRLLALFHDDTEALEQMLGRDLSRWKK